MIVMMIPIEVRHLQHPTHTRRDAQDINPYVGVPNVDLELALNYSHCHALEVEGEGGGEDESQYQADPLIVEDHGLAA